MRIDAHHHVWDLAVRPQSWMGPEEAATIGRNFSIADWAAAAEPTGLTHSVVVQTVPDPAETPELLAMAAATSSVLGVVGWVDMDRDDVEAQLDALLAQRGGDYLVSLRDLTQYRSEGDWLAGSAAFAAFTAVGARGRAVDLLITPPTVPAATRAVAAHPQTRFIVNHLAKPDLDAVSPSDWAATMAGLAQCPNAAIKLSGVATLTEDFATSRDRVAAYADATLDLFGSDRVMFGSDWPVVLLGATYADLVATVEAWSMNLSPSEQHRLWEGTALEWYALPTPEETP